MERLADDHVRRGPWQRVCGLFRRNSRGDRHCWSGRPAMLPLGVEIEDVLQFLDLLQARFQRRVDVTVRLKGAAVREVLVPALLLHALVDNAMSHGFAPDERRGSIEIAARAEAGRLHLDVRDDGHGEIEQVMAGAGTAYVRHFLEAVYGGAAGVNATALAGRGTMIELVLPQRARAG